MIHYKAIGRVLFLIVIIMTIPAVFAGDVDEMGNLDSISSIDASSTANGNSFQELQDMINAADEGSTIYLTNNYAYDDTFATDGINIYKSITIEGNSFTIDGLNKARIFNVFSENVVLNNITFANGHNQDGGAIMFNGYVSNSQITNCNFINNTAENEGGAIYFPSSVTDTLFDHLQFINNSAERVGGGIFLQYPTYNNFTECLFSNNAAVLGASIYTSDVVENSVFENLNFINNHAEESAGGLYMYAGCENSVFRNINFINNSANVGGAFNSMYFAVRSSFKNITSINNSGRDGGAINFALPIYYCEFDDLLFINNHASNGGAMQFGEMISGSSFNNIKFINNSADYGGAVFTSVDVRNSIFNNSVFINNRAINGSAFYAHGLIIGNLFNKINFSNNIAENAGTFYFLYYKSIDNVFNDTLFQNNVAQQGSAIFFEQVSNNTIVNNTVFINNTAYLGSLIYYIDGVVQIIGCEFYNNTGNNTDIIRKDPHMDVIVDDSITFGEILNASVYLPMDATGNITVSVDGTEVMNLNVTGAATFIHLENLPAGSHLINIIYNGDYYYEPASNITEVVVNRRETFISADSRSFDVNDVKLVDVTLKTSDNAVVDRLVTMLVDGKSYIARTDDNGVAMFTIQLAKEGGYPAIIKFDGDSTYLPSNNDIMITIVNSQVIPSGDNPIAPNYKMTESSKGISIQLIKLVIFGKTYFAQMDDNGVARFTVELDDGSECEVTIEFVNGSPNNSFKLTIGNESYSSEIDSNGVARFTIDFPHGDESEAIVEFV